MFLDSLLYEVTEGEDVIITVAIPNDTVLERDISVSIAFELEIGELHFLYNILVLYLLLYPDNVTIVEVFTFSFIPGSPLITEHAVAFSIIENDVVETTFIRTIVLSSDVPGVNVLTPQGQIRVLDNDCKLFGTAISVYVFLTVRVHAVHCLDPLNTSLQHRGCMVVCNIPQKLVIKHWALLTFGIPLTQRLGCVLNSIDLHLGSK